MAGARLTIRRVAWASIRPYALGSVEEFDPLDGEQGEIISSYGPLEVGKTYHPGEHAMMWGNFEQRIEPQPFYVLREATRQEHIANIRETQGDEMADRAAFRCLHSPHWRYYEVLMD